MASAISRAPSTRARRTASASARRAEGESSYATKIRFNTGSLVLCAALGEAYSRVPISPPSARLLPAPLALGRTHGGTVKPDYAMRLAYRRASYRRG